jgi:hypothetical protein
VKERDSVTGRLKAEPMDRRRKPRLKATDLMLPFRCSGRKR